ncbi:MAG: hypothetical protein LUD15_02515 [Bacteroides sp.]|nr:hypothetical protein [Bacteroides sp.]
MFSRRFRSVYLDKKKEHQSFRGELFNIEQLGEYARLLAREQRIGPGTKNSYLRSRLDDNEKHLQSYNTRVLSDKDPRYISPATEWLVDNFYLIEEHI